MTEKNTVEQPCYDYLAQMETWRLISDLTGGTSAMRKAGTQWLPKEKMESVEAYNNRLNQSFLYNGFGSAVDRLASRPFNQPVTMKGELPERLQGMLTDMDRQGTDLTPFLKQVFETGIRWGIVHVLVDFPVTTGEETIAQERDLRLNPYCVVYDPTKIIGWKYQWSSYNVRELTQVRIKECLTVDDGEFGTKTVPAIRVLEPGKWRLYAGNDGKGEYYLVAEGQTTMPRIPLLTAYIGYKDFMVGNPPYLDLAWVNIAHWQSQSDQRNILHYSRLPILFFKGLTANEKDEPIVLGGNTAFKSTSESADGKYIEHSGAAIGAGREDIMHLEAQMETLGLQPFVERSSDATATGKGIEEARNISQVKCWIQNIEALAQNIFKLAGEWVGIEISEELTVDIFSDFSISTRRANDLAELRLARLSGQIDQRTYLQEVKKRGVLSDEVSVDEVMAAVDTEGAGAFNANGQ